MDITANIINNKSVEVILDTNTKVLYSYNIPVAAFLDGVFYKTNKNIPPHVHKIANNWVDNPVSKPQVFFDNFLARL